MPACAITNYLATREPYSARTFTSFSREACANQTDLEPVINVGSWRFPVGPSTPKDDQPGIPHRTGL